MPFFFGSPSTNPGSTARQHFKLRLITLVGLFSLFLTTGLFTSFAPGAALAQSQSASTTSNSSSSKGTSTGGTKTAPVRPGTSPRLLTATATALTTTPNPALFNQTVTMTATVTVSGSGGTNTPVTSGTVTFKDGVTTLSTVTVNSSGQAVFSTATLTLGLHSLTAVYNGNLTYAPSTSPVVFQTVVDHLLTGTATTLTSSANPSTSGQSVTFTANVASLGLVTTIVPTGTVTFLDGTTTLASLPLAANGQAAYTIANLAVGTHPITAQYSGDSNYAASTSAALSQVVSSGGGVLTATSTALVSNPNPSLLNQTVNLTATVTSSGSGGGAGSVPTGSVTFFDGTTVLGTANLDANGNASFSAGQLGLGVHLLTAQYNGSLSYATSTSSVVIQTVVSVSLIATTTSLTSSANPQTVGQSVSFTAQVTAAGNVGAAPSPTGTVTFFDGGTTLGTAAVNSSGLAVFSTSSLAVGTHVITARYEGDSNYSGSTSSQLNQTINNAELSGVVVTLTVTPNPAVAGQPVTVSVMVRAASGAPSPIPSGLITFRDGAGILASVTLDASGNASYTTSALSAGTHDLSAVYGGDTNYASGTSNTVSLVVNSSAGLSNSATSLVSSANPALLGQNLIFTATVTAAAGVSTTQTPTGLVTFKEGATVVGTASLDPNGQAALTLSNLGLGLHIIQAQYGGDSAFNGSVSNSVNELIVSGNLLSTTTGLTSSLRAAAVGQVVTFTATVSPTNGGGAGTPGGTVTFKDAGTTLGTVAVDAQGQASFATATFAVGTHTITAEYIGNNTYSASASAGVSLTVKTVADCLVVTLSDDTDLSCGTLREAILLGNALVGSQPVTVTVSTNSVSVSSPLPTLTNNSANTFSLVAGCTVDNASGRGVPGTSLSRANGATFAGAGLNLTNRILVRGFAIGSFNGYGVAMAGNGNALECNWLGTLDGTTASPNTAGGLQIAGSNNRLGQAGQVSSGNLISGNTGWGVRLVSGTANTSNYSWVGLSKSGTVVAALKNGSGPLQVQAGAQLKLGLGNRFQA